MCLCEWVGVCVLACFCVGVIYFTATRNITCHGRRFFLHSINNGTFQGVSKKCRNTSQSVAGHYIAKGRVGGCLQDLLQPIAAKLNLTQLYVRADNSNDNSSGIWKIPGDVQGSPSYSQGSTGTTANKIPFAICTKGKLFDALR